MRFGGDRRQQQPGIYHLENFGVENHRHIVGRDENIRRQGRQLILFHFHKTLAFVTSI